MRTVATQSATPPPPGGTSPRVAAIIPAYNEEARIGVVLQALTASGAVDEIIVVDDGSTDGTAEAARRVPSVQVVTLPRNGGKGGAMREGATRTQADVLLFFDADLIGLTPAHVRDLLVPVCGGEATMAMGIFRGGRFWTDMAQTFAPAITGQRAIRRAVFLQIPDLEKVGYGIELAINDFVHRQGLVRRDVTLRGVTHPMKEEKLGWARGVASRARMYGQMLRFRLSLRREPKKTKRGSKNATRNGTGKKNGTGKRG